jgi:hypothetical protein
MARDRLAQLNLQNLVTGIDFVFVWPDQVTLDVFFLTDPRALALPLNRLPGLLRRSQIRIYPADSPENGPFIPVRSVLWRVNNHRHVLRVVAARAGGFQDYRLFIDDPRIDPYYNRKVFSFKVNCDSQIDCGPAELQSALEDSIDFPVDYTARDFWSIRQALLDFASQRYPDWKDRMEADMGVMLAEVMSALGDEMSYVQDRIAREAYLETASQRHSLRRLAHLVDYEPYDGRGAFVWLDFQIGPGSGPSHIIAGTKVWEANGRIVFEVGNGLGDQDPNLHVGTTTYCTKYPVHDGCNEFSSATNNGPYIWDEEAAVLKAGATELFLEGADALALKDPPGRWVLLKTRPTRADVPERRWMVHLKDVTPARDLVFDLDLTRIEWEAGQATPWDLDLETLVVRGNLVPATAGETRAVAFRIGLADNPLDPEDAVECLGPNGSEAFLYSLPGSDESPLVWAKGEDESARPDIRLYEASPIVRAFVDGKEGWKYRNEDEWEWRSSFVGVNSSQPNDRHFALDDGMWKRVVGYERPAGPVVHRDYAFGEGKTVRFGDGEFGRTPDEGQVFQAIYRLGHGRRSNAAQDTLVGFHKTDPYNVALSLPFVDAVTNPLPAFHGADPESSDSIRRNAPAAFRAITYRAVRPEDYAEAAERLEWVQRAGCSFRWTGSWLTAFVTPDPAGATEMTSCQRTELVSQIDRFRQAGRQVSTLDPVYADLDLKITVCVSEGFHQGDVRTRILECLVGTGGPDRSACFFSADNFTFGTPLERSRLEAEIQRVAGVLAVDRITIRRRGWFAERLFTELFYKPGQNEVIRIENNPTMSNCGSVAVTVVERG